MQLFQIKNQYFLDLPQGKYEINGKLVEQNKYGNERICFDGVPTINQISEITSRVVYQNLETGETISESEYVTRLTELKSKATPPETGSDVLFTNEFPNFKDKIAFEVFGVVWRYLPVKEQVLTKVELEIIEHQVSEYNNIAICRNIDNPKDKGAIFHQKDFVLKTIQKILGNNGFVMTESGGFAKNNNTYKLYDFSNEISVWFGRAGQELHRKYEFKGYGGMSATLTGSYEDMVAALKNIEDKITKELEGDISTFGGKVDAAAILKQLSAIQSCLSDIPRNTKNSSSLSAAHNILNDTKAMLKN